MSGLTAGLRIVPDGTYTVDVLLDGVSIGTAYAGAGRTGAVALPLVVSSDTTLFVPAPGTYRVSCSVSGVEVFAPVLSAAPGTVTTLAPSVDPHEQGAVSSATTTGTPQTWTAAKTLADGVDLVLGSASGSRIGTAASQKVAFFGAVPVAQPAALTAANASSVDVVFGSEEAAVINNLRVRLNELETRLRNLGLLA